MVASGFATNEVLCFLRIFVLTLNSANMCSGNAAASAIQVHSLGAVNRVLSSKAIEYLELIAAFGQSVADDEEIGPLASEIFLQLRPLRRAKAFKFAKRVRHAVSHHYSLNDFERFVEGAAGVEARIWLAEMEGNSSYFFGEELTNVGMFLQANQDAEVALADWIDWTRDASRLISKVNSDFTIAMMQKYVPEIGATERTELLSARLFADINSTAMPLFWRPFNAVGR